MVSIPESLQDLVTKPIVASLTTIAPDGIPENTAIWFTWDDNYIRVSTVDGRKKVTNIRQNPNATLFVIDPENSGRWIDIRGTISIEPDDDYAVINHVAKKYVGVDEFYGGVAPAENKGTEDRVVLKLTPNRIASQG